ncbi:facilitated trehalose transporter Tret1-2 homolog [Topomyia yanbarensis]|uniref:facilitated trehalose transporter Tret1-2 homolog n=1 Tax=Topomyia yanbarensis TaxID=2498891 RepID=UPI00273AD885|nr:facilitated trehalose transporter Tret1-2 homolog [Topomyia yanbarensis]XP_058831276.1 facilitated trehalose transporter Tret1-2 homolog [Topomyia yanbarensis]XP_058831277.1 facilitated trehalose transporter Tret1-2 homolog [Topomyia yanbarensis]
MVIKKAIADKAFIESQISSKRFHPFARQIIAATGPIISSAAAGMTNGFSAILLPQLQKPDSSIQITSEQSSWIASMAPLPMAAGCLLGGLLMEKFGRKVTHLILNISFAVGFCVLSVALTYDMILVGRFITGFSCGLVGPPASVYIAETSNPKYRGILLAGVTFAVSTGIFLSHLFGTFFHWKMAALFCSFFMAVSYVFVVLCPESPAWLLSKGQRHEAENAFHWLRGYDAESTKEFNDMAAKYGGSTDAGGSQEPTPSTIDNVLRKEFVIPLVTLLVFFFTMQFSGVNIVAFYSISLMKTTIGSDINEYLAMLIVDLVRVITSLFVCILLRTFGRRPLAMLSGCGTTISLIGLSIFLYFQTSIPLYQNLSWMSLIFLISYIIFIGIGLFPLPWCMSGEIFPIATRGIGSGLTSSFNFICFFVVIKTGPTLFETVGTNGTFMVYGIISLIGTLLLYMILPETKNRTLQEIEDTFKSGWRASEKVQAIDDKV